jgi:hypothetical protein
MTTPAGDALYSAWMDVAHHTEVNGPAWKWWLRLMARCPDDVFV